MKNKLRTDAHQTSQDVCFSALTTSAQAGTETIITMQCAAES